MQLDKVTYSRNGSPITRHFDDACGMAHGLELLGERWALFVVRELMLGPRRFSDLKSDLPGISANILTQRLSNLELRGVVTRSKLPPPANVQVYGLTDWGYEAEPIVQELGRWAARSPHHDPTLNFSPVSAMLSLRTMINVAKAATMNLVVSFRFDETAYRGHVRRGEIEVTRGEATDAAIQIAGSPSGLAALVYGKAPREDLADAGLLIIKGKSRDITQFVDLFSLPPKAEAAPTEK